MQIRCPVSVDEVIAAQDLFDGPVRREWAARFLDLPTHHLLIAYVDQVAAGMVTGVEMTMPDKGTEMFLYELGVLPAFRRRGIARALVAELSRIARDRGCYGMWVLTDPTNVAARATYERMPNAEPPETSLMVAWPTTTVQSKA
jgi:ribosomal protein S18 acetylase RimI-like enzyme